jgi:hypothetical protein
MIEYAIERLLQEQPASVLEVLRPDTLLVPMPRSAPFPPGPDALWTPRRIAQVLVTRGLGSGVLPCLRRERAVQRSSTAPAGARPSPLTHLQSMIVDIPPQVPERVTIVDDVITKGATMLAAYSLLKDAFPNADVQCFALVRIQVLLRGPCHHSSSAAGDCAAPTQERPSAPW